MSSISLKATEKKTRFLNTSIPFKYLILLFDKYNFVTFKKIKGIIIFNRRMSYGSYWALRLAF